MSCAKSEINFLLFITRVYGLYIKVSNKAFNRNISNMYEWFSAGKKKYFGSLSRTVTSMTYSPLITLEITCARYIILNLKSEIRQRAKPLHLPQIYTCDREGMSTSHFLLWQTWRVRFPNNQLSIFEKQYSIFISLWWFLSQLIRNTRAHFCMNVLFRGTFDFLISFLSRHTSMS